MKITYKLEKKDYFAFNLNQMKNFPKIRRSINIQRFLMPIMFTVFVFILAKRNNAKLTTLVPIYGALVLGWIFLYPKILINSMNKRLNKFLEADGNENLLSERTIEVSEEGIYEILTNEQGVEEQILAAKEILKAEENEEYVYVFLNTQSVYLIPKQFFKSNDEQVEFLDKVGELVSGE